VSGYGDTVKLAPERRLAYTDARDLVQTLLVEWRQRHGQEVEASTTPDDRGSYARHVRVDGGAKIVLHLPLNRSRSVLLAKLWVTCSALEVKVRTTAWPDG
jgi:hypothetical protein